MKKYLLILTVTFIFGINAIAQVGVGTIPNSNSILDLSNSNKFIQLPVATVVPTSTTLDTVGAMIYYNGNIYLRTTAGIKVFTPWKWNGSDLISSPSGNSVGIGTIPVSNSNRLQIADATTPGVNITSGSTASIAIGTSTSKHLLMDNDEIMVKKDLVTADTLNLQRDDDASGNGVVAVRMSAIETNATVLKVNGSVDATPKGKIKENGADLVPAGSIAMWNSTIIPAGWALCDGGPKTLVAGGTLNAPDLRDRFIVGALGDNPLVAGAGYTIGITGGSVSSNHTHPINPTPVTSGFGSGHVHTGTTDGSDSKGICAGVTDVNYGSNGHTHTVTTNSETSHTHSIEITPGTSLGSSVIENRPPYYALIYIIKL